VLDELSFDAPEKKGEHVTIDADYVRKMLTDIVRTRICRDTFCRFGFTSGIPKGRVGAGDAPAQVCSATRASGRVARFHMVYLLHMG